MKRTFGCLTILTLLLSACEPTPTAAPSQPATTSLLPPSPTPMTVPSPTLTPSPPPPSPTPMPEPTPDPDELHLLVRIEGTVELKRLAWSDYQPATLGARVRRGDLLLPDGRIAVLCADLSLHELRAESGVPCPVQEPVLWRGESKVVTPRSSDELIPYILHPRRTRVLTPRPWLRWHDTGAGSYTVIVRGDGQEWKQRGVTGSEMQYPTDAPPLKSGVDYLLVVMDEDSGRSSTEDPCKGLGFRVLTDEERTAVEARAAEIEALALDELARRFALATYYAGQELRGEALMLLDELSGTLDTPAVHLWRGDVLRETALSDEAAVAYQEALERAETLDDRESQARAHVGLARTLADKAKVKQHYEQAIDLYEALGHKAQVDALRDKFQRRMNP
jgi:hypothetical protein